MIMSRTILAMYSGGLDSAGVLHRLLADDEFTDFSVHVHHMHVVNRENRAPAEAEAVKKTLSLFGGDGYRPFQYTQSLHRYDFFRRDHVWDMDLCAFVAGNICSADTNIVHVAMGRARTGQDSGDEDFFARMERAQQIFKAVISLDDSEASCVFPVLKLTKKQVWDMLPKAIRKSTWSCRRPVYDEERNPLPCGKCHACRERVAHGLK